MLGYGAFSELTFLEVRVADQFAPGVAAKFNALIINPTAKREYLIHMRPFKLNPENPTT